MKVDLVWILEQSKWNICEYKIQYKIYKKLMDNTMEELSKEQFAR